MGWDKKRKHENTDADKELIVFFSTVKKNTNSFKTVWESCACSVNAYAAF